MPNAILEVVENEVQKLIEAHGAAAVHAVIEKLKEKAPPLVDAVLDSVEPKLSEVVVGEAHKLADKIDGEVG